MAFAGFVRTALGAGAALAALAAAGLGLAMHGGRWSLRLDALNHGAPAALLVAVLALLGVLALRRVLVRRLFLGVAAFAVLCLGSLVLPEAAARLARPQPPADAPRLKVLQFNLWGANPDTDATLDWILDQDADVLILQEAFGTSDAINAALRAAYPNWSSCDPPRPCSVMVMSRLPTTFQDGGQGPPWALARFLWRGQAVSVIGAHYFWPWPPGPQARQAGRLAERVRAEAARGGAIVVAGDFNATPWSFALKRQDEAFGLRRATRALFSFPARPIQGRGPRPPFPFLPIDHVYAGGGLVPVSVRRGPRLGSDHYPVAVELALQPR